MNIGAAARIPMAGMDQSMIQPAQFRPQEAAHQAAVFGQGDPTGSAERHAFAETFPRVDANSPEAVLGAIKRLPGLQNVRDIGAAREQMINALRQAHRLAPDDNVNAKSLAELTKMYKQLTPQQQAAGAPPQPGAEQPGAGQGGVEQPRPRARTRMRGQQPGPRAQAGRPQAGRPQPGRPQRPNGARVRGPGPTRRNAGAERQRQASAAIDRFNTLAQRPDVVAARASSPTPATRARLVTDLSTAIRALPQDVRPQAIQAVPESVRSDVELSLRAR
jgi:hypothetical protein